MAHARNTNDTVEYIKELLTSDEIQALDVSMFEPSDYLNMILQRSEILFDIHRPNRSIRAWSAGDDGPLKEIVETLGEELVLRTIAFIKAEYDEPSLQKTLKAINPTSISDIGCGYAFFDLFAAKQFQTKIDLIDIETSINRNFGYKKSGSGYTNLERAKSFLVANGLPEEDIRCFDPNKDNLDEIQNTDLAISLLSCGFHYPEGTYSEFFEKNVSESGHVILDRRIRPTTRHNILENYGQVEVLLEYPNFYRVHLQKQAGTRA